MVDLSARPESSGSYQVIPAMKAAGLGTMIFIGATASRRAAPRTAAGSEV
jgi:hypothetical protein